MTSGTILTLLAALALGWIVTTRIAMHRWTHRLSEPESDVWFHLAAASAIRDAHHRVPRRLPRFVMPGEYTYPFLVHWGLSWMPPRWMLIADRYFAMVIDLSHALVILAGTAWLASAIPSLAGMSTEIAIWGLTWFCVSPLTVIPGDARLEIGGRAPGELLLSVYFIGLAGAAVGWTPAGYVLSAFAGGLGLLASKFATQALVGFSLTAAAFLWSAAPLIGLALSVLTAMLASGGAYRRVLVGHVRHSIFYRKVLMSAHRGTTHRRLVFSMTSFRNAWAHSRGAALWNLLAKDHVLVHAFLHCPLPFIATAVVLWHGLPADAGRALALSAAWTGASVLAFLLTSLPPLRFLGESERYLDFAFVPATLAWIAVVGNPRDPAIVSSGWLVIPIVCISIILFYLKVSARRGPAADGAAAWLPLWNSLVDPPDAVTVTLTLPHKLSQVCAFGAAGRYVYHHVNFSLEEMPEKEFRLLFDRFPDLTDEGAVELVARYGVGRIVGAGERYVAQAKRIVPGWDVVAEEARFVILRRPS